MKKCSLCMMYYWNNEKLLLCNMILNNWFSRICVRKEKKPLDKKDFDFAVVFLRALCWKYDASNDCGGGLNFPTFWYMPPSDSIVLSDRNSLYLKKWFKQVHDIKESIE